MATGQVIAQKMGEGLLQQQVSSSKQDTSNESDSMPGMGGRGMNSMARGAMPGLANQSASNVEQIDEINVSAGIKEYATIFGLGYLILIVAMVLPSVNILRYQPKTILTGKE